MGGLKPCAICGEDASSVRVLYGTVEPKVLECATCRLRYVDAAPTVPELAAMYDAYTNMFMLPVYESQHGAYAKDFEEKLSGIEALVGGRGRILDVGCGCGQFLAVAKARGWQIAGVDIAHAAVERSNALLGHVVQCCTLDQADFPAESFDAITMWDLVEHLSDPRPTILAATRLLRSDGVLVIRTPSSRSLASVIAHALYWMTGGRAVRAVAAQYNYFHLYRYAPATLDKLTTMCGFSPIAITHENSSFAVFASQHPGLGRGLPKKALLYAFFVMAALCRRQNKIVLTCRKEGVKLAR